jgi:hypothetical protein
MRRVHEDGDTPMSESPEAPHEGSAPRPGASRRIALVVGGVAAVLVAVFLVLPMVRYATGDTASRLASNSRVVVSQSGEILLPGGQSCVRRLSVPENTGSVRVFPGFDSPTAPPLEVTVSAGGRTLLRRSVAAYRTNVPLTVAADVGAPGRRATVCFRNRGAEAMSLAHARLPGGPGANPVRVDVFSKPVAFADALPVALTRASLFKGGLVSRPVVALLLVLVLALAALAVAAVVRGGADEETHA